MWSIEMTHKDQELSSTWVVLFEQVCEALIGTLSI